MEWDDYRMVLALARAGGLKPAAETLRVDPSTVYRRAGTLEAALGVRLFDRTGGQWRPTEAGQAMAAAAERMEAEALGVERALAGRDLALAGRLRVTSSETLAWRLLTRHIARFRALHPGITIELVVDNRLFSLARREADVALRPFRPSEPDLWGRKLADVAWTLYRHVDQPDRPLVESAVIGWNEGADTNAARWLASQVPDAAVVYRSGSLLNQLAAAKAGIGVAALPCFLGDSEPSLVRAADPVPALTRELWMVTHEDLRRTARVRSFMEEVGQLLQHDSALLEGRGS